MRDAVLTFGISRDHRRKGRGTFLYIELKEPVFNFLEAFAVDLAELGIQTPIIARSNLV